MPLFHSLLHTLIRTLTLLWVLTAGWVLGCTLTLHTPHPARYAILHGMLFYLPCLLAYRIAIAHTERDANAQLSTQAMDRILGYDRRS